VDEVVGRDPQVARNLHMGDYTNLSAKLDIALPGVEGGPDLPLPTDGTIDCTSLDELPNDTPLGDLPKDLCEGAAKKIQKCIDNPSPKNCEGVPTAIVKQAAAQICDTQPNNPLCELLPDGPLGGTGGGTGGGGPTLPPIPGLPRAGFGSTDTGLGGGPTVGDLMKVYDPDLVALLVPGMVVR
jgi:phospholipid/cholesterol/gamma-HCH transport system substrate-binding protein